MEDCRESGREVNISSRIMRFEEFRALDCTNYRTSVNVTVEYDLKIKMIL